MKNIHYLSLLVILLGVILFVSCHNSSPIEKSFKKHIEETYANKNDFKGIKSIELLDSIDVYGIAQDAFQSSKEIKHKKDSVFEVFQSKIQTAPSRIVYSSKFQNKLQKLMSDMRDNVYETSAGTVATNTLGEVLDSIQSMNRFSKSYKLKTEFSSSPEYVIYYAQTVPFSDSIVFSKGEPVKLDQLSSFANEVLITVELASEGSKITLRQTELIEELLNQIK